MRIYRLICFYSVPRPAANLARLPAEIRRRLVELVAEDTRPVLVKHNWREICKPCIEYAAYFAASSSK
jgi:hypothetical protein